MKTASAILLCLVLAGCSQEPQPRAPEPPVAAEPAPAPAPEAVATLGPKATRQELKHEAQKSHALGAQLWNELDAACRTDKAETLRIWREASRASEYWQDEVNATDLEKFDFDACDMMLVNTASRAMNCASSKYSTSFDVQKKKFFSEDQAMCEAALAGN
ncbi:hypothetical protein ACFONC_11745 [Luteimonas soli]|uniref:DUF1311 domain-containing protein n=1 Tax=Luteimonas soli TaxID=1648966 RepID=A0ABV7XL99_9GAMM